MSESIKGSKSSNYIQEPIPGISESSDQMTHVSVQNLWDGRGAQDVLIHALHRPSLLAMVIESGSVRRKIKITSHGARKGDFLKLVNGNSSSEDVAIIKVIDADFFVISKEINASVGDSAEIWRAVTPAYNADGSLNVAVTPSPVSYSRKSAGLTSTTTVLEDLDTPTNSRALPVVIHSIDGAPINITAGDLNIATSHVNDSMAIGDGTNLVGVTVSNELKTHDADLLTQANLLATSAKQDLLLAELELKADLTETQPVSVASLPLPAGAATQATLASLLTELQLKADLLETQPVSGPLTDTQLRAGKVQVGFDPGTIDVFGRVLVGERKNQVDVQFFQGTPASLITVTTVSTGSAVQNAGGGLFSTGTGVSGEVKGVSRQSTTYSAGAEVFMEVTASFVTPTNVNSFQRIGLFDTNEGLYYGYTGLGFGVSLRNNAIDTFVPKASFSEDTLVGAVNSKFTRNGIPEAVDLTKQNVWRLRFGWQGSAPIFYEVMAPDGHFVTIHVIRHPNLAVSAHIRNPNLPITIHLKKTASDATDLQVKTNSWGAGATVSQTRVDSVITDETLVETSRSILTGVTTGGGGGYVNVKVSPSGALVTESTVSGVATSANQVILIAKLPAALGITTAAGSLSIAPASDAIFNTKPKALTSSFVENLALTTVATLTAPANAIGGLIMADDTNGANVRFKQGGVSTITSGMQLQAGRSEAIGSGTDVSICSESGTNKVMIIWNIQA
jgi:hypothetical protein